MWTSPVSATYLSSDGLTGAALGQGERRRETSEVVMAAEPDETEVEAAKAKVREQIAELDDLDYQVQRRKEREAIERRKAQEAREDGRPR